MMTKITGWWIAVRTEGGGVNMFAGPFDGQEKASEMLPLVRQEGAKFLVHVADTVVQKRAIETASRPYYNAVHGNWSV